MSKRVLLITGNPGIGKTTLIIKVVDALKKEQVNVGGMVSREVREDNVRVGFELTDLNSLKRGWLAHVNEKSKAKVGKYYVNIEDLDNIGTQGYCLCHRKL